MGEFLSSANKEKTTNVNENKKIKYCSCEMQGWRKRMESTLICDISKGKNERFDIFGIFDGHGGKEVAQFVKNHFVEVFLKNVGDENDISEAIKITFKKVDDLMLTKEGQNELINLEKKSKDESDILDKKINIPNQNIEIVKNMLGSENKKNIAGLIGCSACIVIIDELYKTIYYANAGDSKVVLCNKSYKNEKDNERECNEIPITETNEHRPSNEKESERIEKAGGFVTDGLVMGILQVTRSFGVFDFKKKKENKTEQIIICEPEIKKRIIENNISYLVIGCHGIWECLQENDIVEVIKNKVDDGTKNIKTANLKEIIPNILDEICAKDVYNDTGIGCDNMSCIIVVFK